LQRAVASRGAAREDGVLALRDAGVDRLAETRIATPPWEEHRPFAAFAVEYVPSLHFAVAPAGA
jgi:hypothetical protein